MEGVEHFYDEQGNRLLTLPISPNRHVGRKRIKPNSPTKVKPSAKSRLQYTENTGVSGGDSC